MGTTRICFRCRQRDTGRQSMSHAKADAEALLEVVMPFAEKMLLEHGEFYPFAAAMRSTGEIVSIAAYDGRERPPSDALIELLREELRKDVQTIGYRATAIAYNVTLTTPGSPRADDAIAVALDHRDEYSVVVLYPYVVDAGGVRLDEPVAERGKHAIFGP